MAVLQRLIAGFPEFHEGTGRRARAALPEARRVVILGFAPGRELFRPLRPLRNVMGSLFAWVLGTPVRSESHPESQFPPMNDVSSPLFTAPRPPGAGERCHRPNGLVYTV